jgi:hypothetical protein
MLISVAYKLHPAEIEPDPQPPDHGNKGQNGSDFHGANQQNILGFRPQVLPNVSLQVQKALQALFITFISPAFHVNPLPKVSPRYLTLIVSHS